MKSILPKKMLIIAQLLNNFFLKFPFISLNICQLHQEGGGADVIIYIYKHHGGNVTITDGEEIKG